MELEDDESSPRIKYRCVAMRWQRCNNSHLDHVIALYSYSVQQYACERKGKFAKKFIEDANSRASTTYILVGWKLCKDADRPWMKHELIPPPLYEPKILVTTEDFSKDLPCYPIAIIYEHIHKLTTMYNISIYQVTGAKTVHVPVKPPDVDGVQQTGFTYAQNIVCARFRGSPPELWVYGYDTAPLDNIVGCTVAGMTALSMTSTVSTHRSTPKLFTSKATPRCFKGIALKSRHAHECGVYENGGKFCVQTVRLFHSYTIHSSDTCTRSWNSLSHDARCTMEPSSSNMQKNKMPAHPSTSMSNCPP
jgi:hypothetical protein